MKIPALLVLLVGGLTTGPALAQKPGPAPGKPSEPSLGVEIPRIAQYRAQGLDLPAEAERPFSVDVTLDARPYTLDLEPFSLRAADFQVLVQVEGGDLVPEAAPPVTTYRGHVRGHAGSIVTASLFDGSLRALIELSEHDVFEVQPASDFLGGAAPAGVHVSFRRDDVAPSGYRCGADDVVQLPGDEAQGEAAAAAASGTGVKIAEIACDADVLFYQENGSSVQNTVADMEGVLNTVEFVYERDVDITYEITVMIVRTSAGDNPYTSSNPPTLLCQFRTEWNSAPQTNIRRDVAHLFTGRPIGLNGAIGIAYTSTLCNVTGGASGCAGQGNLAYGVVESRFQGATVDERVSLSAHELGHNWAAQHCNGIDECHIMCDTIDFCDGTQGVNLRFGPTSQSTITGFKNSRTCLEDLPEPLTVPFFEDVPNTTIDTDKWIWRQNVGASADAPGEPSPPNALRLFSFGDAEYRDGEIRSNVIELEGESDIVVRYQVQWEDVEAGELLRVEFRSNQNVWSELNIIASTGFDFGFFFPYEHALPANAYHDGFRLRFRTEGDQADDKWYVDDIYVGPAEIVDPCPQDIDDSGDVGFNDLLSVLSNWGPCVGCPEDLDGSGDVGFADLLEILSNWGPCTP